MITSGLLCIVVFTTATGLRDDIAFAAFISFNSVSTSASLFFSLFTSARSNDSCCTQFLAFEAESGWDFAGAVDAPLVDSASFTLSDHVGPMLASRNTGPERTNDSGEAISAARRTSKMPSRTRSLLRHLGSRTSLMPAPLQFDL